MIMSTESRTSNHISPPIPGRVHQGTPLRLLADLGNRIGSKILSRSLRASRSWSESVSDEILREFGLDRGQITSTITCFDEARSKLKSPTPSGDLDRRSRLAAAA